MILSVQTDTKNYDIVIQSGAWHEVTRYWNLDRRVLVVTDDGVPPQYAATVAAQCKLATVVTLPQGEASKSMEQLQQLLRAMLQASMARTDCVVAVGGGVVGDLSGFAAALYMRGIDFYNMPTTLLSQVDSSIGGKTAVDFEGVKNIVGAFYQPCGVIVCPDLLHTLDERQLRAGLAESIKMAATCDATLFELLESSDNVERDLPDIIARSLHIKRHVVQEDTCELGLRRVLNFGHTVGHAIESFYGGELLHGECVALGMLPFCSPAARERLVRVLTKYGLPTEIQPSAEQLMPFVMHDKKKQKDEIVTVCVNNVGSFEFHSMNEQQIKHCLENIR